MLTAVRWMLSRLVSPLWRSVDADEDGFLDCSGAEDIRHLRGSVVTQLCLDYGMIDDAVFFTSNVVLGGMLLKKGDLVNCIALRDGVEGGWKALRVEKSSDAWDDGGRTSLEADSLQLRPLIGTVTSFDGNDGYINQTTYFAHHSLLQGYEPMKGDWVQAQYFINPTQWTTQAHSVTPLRYSRLDQVRVTSVFGTNGVVEDSVFFSLNSLLLPAHYQPLEGDLVNVVMVESTQSLYSWRALCMAPCPQSRNISATPLLQTEVLENKEGLDVSDYGQFGEANLGERLELVIWIQNQGSEVHTLKGCEFAGWDSEEQFTVFTVKKSTSQSPGRHCSKENCSQSSENQVKDSKEDTAHQRDVRKAELEVKISPGERLSVVISCQAKSLGSCAELLLLHFSSFTIGRRLEVTVCCENENLLQPSEPYYKPIDTKLLLKASPHVITVSAPKEAPRFSKRRLPNFLPSFPVPKALRDCVEAQSDVLVAQPCLGEVLSPFNMQSRFSALLWLEELHAEKEVKELTISGALLRKGAASLHLEVLGLSEGRPNLNIGDRVILKKPRGDGVILEFVSCVTEINDEDVGLRVNSDFQHSYVGEPLDVEFTFNRLTVRRCHNALEQSKHFEEIFFPSRVTLQTPQWTVKWKDESPATEDERVSSASIDTESKATQTKVTDGKLASKPIPSKGQFFNLDLNSCQKEAVKNILAGECRPLPYVLFGPPGTGKTITLIEAILQVYHFLPSSRVLVCTPSNSAADLICIRLHYSGFLHATSLARVNASCRGNESIPEVLQPYSKAGEDIRQAAFHRIVVSTCSSAGMFHSIGIQVGHFTHVFLDEAGQATEPESLIPISFVSEKDGQIVLAGDPCQLGPVVKSKLASAFGLGVSLIERLMSNPLYSKKDWGYNPKLVTKLIFNYRCHEALLALPSKLFYQGELCFKAPRDVVESLCQWKSLPRKGFPLIFHGVRGTEMREGNNPSWFNPAEAVQVMLYCCQLAKKLSNPVNTSDIGIIAPYRKQCEKIRMLLCKVGLSEIKVGSVEEFQGQEFLVIIMSTVRSNESMESADLQSSMGFLANQKRFNVAITRSKALLLIIGNPHILIRDPCFRALLQYCYNNGVYLGCDAPLFLRDTQRAAE
ncbi:RNA helicase Mov10l1 [Austrofundulus limnaeus]|uniref:RNA helicase n=1 Tax=Austrofundulus limnaeus TaxID=52670 RepID=A0A2I4C8G7_AUSLI|nr:PREDICTED: putative helicase Mov10l1 [Austrofundulus limnaeus]